MKINAQSLLESMLNKPLQQTLRSAAIFVSKIPQQRLLSGTLCFRRFRLAVSGGGSNPPALVLFSVVLSYLKNRLLTTLGSSITLKKVITL